MVELGRSSRSWRWWIMLPAVILLVVAAYFLLQPRIVSVSPPSGSSGLSATSPIEIQFNRPMNRSTVESRLVLSPEVAGEFTWQADRVRFIPDDKWPEGAIIDARLRAGSRSVLSLPILVARSWSFRISQPGVVYLRRQNGANQLELRVLDESESRILLEASAGVAEFDVVPGQSALITVELQKDGSSQLVWRNLSGELLRVMNQCPADIICRRPVLSADGDWLAWQQRTVRRSSSGVMAMGPWQVYVKSINHDEPPRLLGGEGVSRSPQWVRSNRLAIYSEGTKSLLVYENEPEGASWRQVAQVRHELGHQWSWSPEGRFVIFPEVSLLENSESGINFFSHLIRVEVDSGLSTDLSGDDQDLIEDASPTYSPDGLRVAFARKSLNPAEWSLGRQLFVMGADGSDQRPLTSAPEYNHSEIQWHADGNRLIFIRFNQAVLDSPTEIWWYDLAADQAQIIVEGGFNPQWMP